MALALFDLDHTLLSGDSDVLWCEFLVAHGQLPRERLAHNDEMAARYAAGTVSVEAFCGFYVATLAGRSAADWAPWLARFLDEVIRPRIPDDARALLARHRDAGDTLVLTSATNRVITARTAAELGVAHLIATEAELRDGVYTGRTAGVPNMREGKVERLRGWLQTMGLPAAALQDAVFYSDSANDLPLLRAVGRAVAVDPDERLHAAARGHGWPVIHLRR